MSRADDLPPIRSVAVVGVGYVGLPLCLHLAKAGLHVTAVDVDPKVVREITERTSKVEEKEDFQKFFQDPDVQKNLVAQEVPTQADAFVVAVPTPVNHADKSPDLRALVAACESLVPYLRPGNLVVVESTIPPLTTERIVKPILEKSGYRVGPEILLAHCPERILPGNIMAEAVFNAKLVGGVDDRSTARAASLFGMFVKGKLLLTNERTAEFVKLIENAFRDVNVAFANEVSVLCERLKIDTDVAIAFANEHPRVQILSPGIGVGGHCIPIDPWFLVHTCPELAGLLRAARVRNDEMPWRTAEKILRAVEGVENPRIVCVGATYKPNVRDMRESPALEVFRLLKAKTPDVSIYDPLLTEYACDSVLAVARDADAVAILVPHDFIVTEIRFRKPAILAAMRRPVLLAFTPGVL